MRVSIEKADIVVDECVPHDLYDILEYVNYEAILGSEWEGYQNGDLLKLCRDKNVKVLLTCDKAMENKQIEKMPNFSFSIVILNSKDNDTESLESGVKKFVELYSSNSELFKKRTFYLLNKDSLMQSYIQNEYNYGQISIGHSVVLTW
jgi:predicted nuclease of predicted toxin-antitoxin system